MKMLNLIVSSKDKKSLNKFFIFLNENSLTLKFNFINKNFQKKIKKTVITILKSPHINKTAQEQFEIRYISKQIQICTTNLYKFLIFLKKLKTSIFPDINIKIKIIHNNKLIKKKIFNIDHFYNTLFFKKLNLIQNNKLKVNKNMLFYSTNRRLIQSIDSQKIIKLIDTYGNY